MAEPKLPEEHTKMMDAVNEWPLSKCTLCGKAFPKDKSFASRCPICYKISNNYSVLQGDKAFLWVQLSYAELEEKNAELLAVVGKLK